MIKKAASQSDRYFLLEILEVNLYKSSFLLDKLTGLITGLSRLRPRGLDRVN